jgi:hypothetical protein
MQREVVDLVRRDWDYRRGNLEILLSGSYGSAKSILMAHLVVTHCLLNRGARACLGRRGLPDLKRTILKEILEHISVDMVEGKHYVYNRSESTIRFSNGSEIISISWADRRFQKGRSLKLSMLVIEEIVESDSEEKEAIDTLKARLRRLPNINENLFIAATNPDSPGHWVYKYWIDPVNARLHDNRKVFYSLTEDNPFLDAQYIEGLRKDLSPKEADRYLRGKWIELRTDYIYYEYRHEFDYVDADYQVNTQYPIYISYDFNIAAGKPLSACLAQYVDGVWHAFDEVVIEGFRTEDSLVELANRGILDYNVFYEINGDASGKHNDTRSKRSDYDIISKFLANYKTRSGKMVDYRVFVPASNPPVRKRHNMLNAVCCNDLGERRLRVYRKAKTLDEGLRLTKLKAGSNYVEDDTDAFQHITTAFGYMVWAAHLKQNQGKQGTTIL